jgi:hypothetical protein
VSTKSEGRQIIERELLLEPIRAKVGDVSSCGMQSTNHVADKDHLNPFYLNRSACSFVSGISGTPSSFSSVVSFFNALSTSGFAAPVVGSH